MNLNKAESRATVGSSGIESRRNLQPLALAIANRILRRLPSTPLRQGSAIPIEQLARSFGAVIIENTDPDLPFGLTQLGLDGAARRIVPEQAAIDGFGWFTSDYEIQVLSKGFRARFTMAHELAHVVLTSEFPHLDGELTVTQKEQLCDLAASSLLLPDQHLMEAVGAAPEGRFDISEIERLSSQMRVSLSLMINRMRQLAAKKQFAVKNLIVLVSLARSRKQNQNMAPRIASACSPRRWFLPMNTRLMSVGLVGLQRAFYEAELYKRCQLKEFMHIWDSAAGERVHVPCKIEFKCYRWTSTNYSIQSQENRLMLATIDLVIQR